MQCKRACPLCPQKRPQKRIPANGDVRFTPESGHSQRKQVPKANMLQLSASLLPRYNFLQNHFDIT